MLRKNQTIQEHLERMKYVSKYVISETPKYKSLIGGASINPLPEYLMKEAGKPEDQAAPAPPATGAPAPDASGAAPLPPPAGGVEPPMPPAPMGMGGGGTPAPAVPPVAPDASNTNVEITTAGDEMQPDVSMGGGMPAPTSPEKKVMELQLDAMRKMSMKIEDLGSVIDNLNQRLEMYAGEVDKVREPSDMEKFENRKDDSSPYYFNLNDLWKDDNFKSRMDQFGKGYVKTEDGYVADYDDLPKLAPHEVKASFDV